MKFVSEYEDEFVRQVMERGTAEHLKQTSSLKKTIDTATRRIEQIDSVISQLYEDKVVGEITSEMFTKLSAKYIAEQEEQSASFKVAQKELRSGTKRIVLASTSKMGTGANIQTKLAALHNLDIPWKPSEVEPIQRNFL